MPTSYNFLKALERMDSRLNVASDSDAKYLPRIPRFEECGVQGSCLVYGTVVSICFNVSEEMDVVTARELKVLESFVAEVCEIFRTNASCRDVIVGHNNIIAVYSTSLKTEINEVIDDLARVRTLPAVIEKRADIKSKILKIKVAACYDKLSMSVVESRNAYKQYLWRGNAITRAISMTDESISDAILINKVIWNNLTENNQKFFDLKNIFEEVYEGKIINLAMNHWLETQK